MLLTTLTNNLPIMLKILILLTKYQISTQNHTTKLPTTYQLYLKFHSQTILPKTLLFATKSYH